MIDAHHHLWDLSKVTYPWLKSKGTTRFFGQPDPIRRNYLPEDYRLDHQGVITRSVHVQVGCKAEHNLLETQLIESYIDLGAPISGIVAAVDVRAKNLPQQIARQQCYPHVKGVRHMIGKSPDEDHQLPIFRAEEWLHGWQTISSQGLTFDLQLTQKQYLDVYQALTQVPDMKVVLCHFASPWDQSDSGFKQWQQAMQQFAQLPNCYIKLSGFSMFTHHFDLDKFIQYSVSAINIFGSNRCMLGSNFPVDKLHMRFEQLHQAWLSLLNLLNEKQQRDLSFLTAENFYSLTN
jgi:predicted TIM-barrel fold metal-dependent hydrolase